MAVQLPQYEILRRQLLSQDPELQRLRQQQAQSRGQLFSAPFQAREENQNIFDPNTREKLISQAVGNVLGQLTGYNELVSQRQGRTDQMVKLVTDYQAEQNAVQEAKAKQQQQEFENQIALAKLQIDRSKVGTGDSPDDEDLSGFVSLALDNYGNEAFDFNTFLTSVPSKQRAAFTREYMAGVAQLQALTPEQQAVTAPEEKGGGIVGGITNFFKGLNAPRVGVPSVPDIGSMTPQEILNRAKGAIKKKTPVKRGTMSPAYKAYLERKGRGGL